MFKKNNDAFTLVELIVVIVILAILATIAFLSFNSYTSSTRDTKRISDVSSIEKGLGVFLVRAGKYLPPDNSTILTISGSKFGYQGFAGNNLLQAIGMGQSDKVIDPLDNTRYIYATDTSTTQYQIMFFLENKDSLAYFPKYDYQKVFAIDYSKRYPVTKGNQNIIVISNTGATINTPINMISTSSGIEITNLDGNIYGGMKTCDEWYKNSPNAKYDGIYLINPTGSMPKPIAVRCDMTTDGGGWTIIQRRINGSVDFFRNWNEYKNGFGSAESEYWLGNDTINSMTSLYGTKELRIDMGTKSSDGGVKRYAKYSNFQVLDESQNYKLLISGYSGDVGNPGLQGVNNAIFSTKDVDNDTHDSSCANGFKGGWWYTNCHSVNLNGLYLNGIHNSYANGINWSGYKGLPMNTPCYSGLGDRPGSTIACGSSSIAGHYYSLSFVEMKIR